MIVGGRCFQGWVFCARMVSFTQRLGISSPDLVLRVISSRRYKESRDEHKIE